MVREIILASANPAKAEEFNNLPSHAHMRFEPCNPAFLKEFKETGTSFAENALLKAQYVFAQCQRPTIADDSGIEVAAMGGKPGIHSKRWLEAYDSIDQAYAIIQDHIKTHNNNRARLVCCLAYVTQARHQTFTGILEGALSFPPRGPRRGMHYDIIFIPDGYNQTLAQLGPPIKSKISHRTKALRAFIEAVCKA